MERNKIQNSQQQSRAGEHSKPSAGAVQNNLCDSLRTLQNSAQKSGGFGSRLIIAKEG